MLRCIVQQPEILSQVSNSQNEFCFNSNCLSPLSHLSFIEIIWRRDDGNPILLKVNNKTRRTDTVEGELISFQNVDRRQMGKYLCIAKNDVPPAVSKMIHLIVHCKLS
jgi:hypothetical protein